MMACTVLAWPSFPVCRELPLCLSRFSPSLPRICGSSHWPISSCFFCSSCSASVLTNSTSYLSDPSRRLCESDLLFGSPIVDRCSRSLQSHATAALRRVKIQLRQQSQQQHHHVTGGSGCSHKDSDSLPGFLRSLSFEDWSRGVNENILGHSLDVPRYEGVSETKNKYEGVSETKNKYVGVSEAKNKYEGVSDKSSSLSPYCLPQNYLHWLHQQMVTPFFRRVHAHHLLCDNQRDGQSCRTRINRHLSCDRQDSRFGDNSRILDCPVGLCVLSRESEKLQQLPPNRPHVIFSSSVGHAFFYQQKGTSTAATTDKNYVTTDRAYPSRGGLAKGDGSQGYRLLHVRLRSAATRNPRASSEQRHSRLNAEQVDRRDLIGRHWEVTDLLNYEEDYLQSGENEEQSHGHQTNESEEMWSGRREPTDGCLVVVVDVWGRPVGWGFWNSHSIFSVRLLQIASRHGWSDVMWGVAPDITNYTDCTDCSSSLYGGIDVLRTLETRFQTAWRIRSAMAGLSAGVDVLKSSMEKITENVTLHPMECDEGTGGKPIDRGCIPKSGCSSMVLSNQSSCGLGVCEDSRTTSGYRLVNVEGDDISGVCVDVFDKQVVVRLSALWVDVWKDRFLQALDNVFCASGLQPDNYFWKHNVGQLKQEGFIERGSGHIRQGSRSSNGSNRPCSFVENGLAFETSPNSAQKTGFFLDQRDNRLMSRVLFSRLIHQAGTDVGYGAGQEVERRQDWEANNADTAIQAGKKSVCGLDLFCYSGGFALNMAAGGLMQFNQDKDLARVVDFSVTAVDVCPRAIRDGKRNAALNGLDGSIEFVCNDAFEYLQKVNTTPRDTTTCLANGHRAPLVCRFVSWTMLTL
eukprot:GHVQ01015858.1.p1 GENE.GHVQ01015858.1~~GHVQ01015858.1.p1  ORF type:complete len:857 (+),score=93.76 GHVQ01015858.1:253-2823(+)